MMDYCRQMRASGQLEARRSQQNLTWVREMADDYFRNLLYNNPAIAAARESIEAQVLSGEIAPTKALNEIVETIRAQFGLRE